MVLIAGPCVIESEDIVLKIADNLQFINDLNIDFYFKASFDKANRSSIDSFRGPGMDKGLKILEKVKKEFGYKLVTDIHESYQAKPVSEIVDILQIPAFLCRQTDLLVEASKTNKGINIKKAQFLSGMAMKHPLNKVLKTKNLDFSFENAKNHNIFLTERGNSFGYDLVVDMKNLVIMREFAPVIFDATHSVQIPSSSGKTLGNSSFVAPLARAASGIGVDGFFFETHTNPEEALSDGPNMITPNQLKNVLNDILKIREVLCLN